MSSDPSLPFTSEGVMKNHLAACRKRLKLWVSDEIVVNALGPLEIAVSHAGRRVVLGFVPVRCQWWLEYSGERVEGSFDRVTKQVRQIMTMPVHS